MEFSEKLQKLRKEKNITQEGLADKLNVSRQAVSKWESGLAYPDTEKLIQISKIFEVSLDELINDDCIKNKDNDNKKLSFMEIFNDCLDFISKSINMFWSMKLLEKIKFLLEMGFLALIILGVAILSTGIMGNILRRILIFLPSNFVFNICNLFETLLYIVWLVLGIMIIVRIFKSRYLDYYAFVTDNSIKERVIEEPIKELKENKEYKVVIRDPEDSSLNIIKKIGKLLMYIIKIICSFIAIPLILFFIFLVIVLVISLVYLFDGLFFNGISITVIGALLVIYLMIEFIYNLIFNREHALHRIFIIFIGGISLIGVGLGLSFVALSSFSYQENIVSEVKVENIDFTSNLVLYPLIDKICDENIVVDDSLDNIRIETTSYGNTDVYLYSYDNLEYKVIDMGYDFDEISLYQDMLNDLKNKKITNYTKYYDIKMYVSRDNLLKLRENINKYMGDNYYE